MKYKTGDTVSFIESNNHLLGTIDGETMKMVGEIVYLVKIIENEIWKGMAVWKTESRLTKVIR